MKTFEIENANNHVYTTLLLKKENGNYAVETLHKGTNKNKSFYREFDNFDDAKEMFIRLK